MTNIIYLNTNSNYLMDKYIRRFEESESFEGTGWYAMSLVSTIRGFVKKHDMADKDTVLDYLRIAIEAKANEEYDKVLILNKAIKAVKAVKGGANYLLQSYKNYLAQAFTLKEDVYRMIVFMELADADRKMSYAGLFGVTELGDPFSESAIRHYTKGEKGYRKAEIGCLCDLLDELDTGDDDILKIERPNGNAPYFVFTVDRENGSKDTHVFVIEERAQDAEKDDEFIKLMGL